MTGEVAVRTETAADVEQVRRVHTLTFGGELGEPTWEARLVDDLRAGRGWVPELSVVAVVGGEVVGHAVATRGRLEPAGGAGTAAVLGLGPIGVLPGHHGAGIGSALVRGVLDRARARGDELVCLLGDPGYYQRFGFVDASSLEIAAPDPAWGAHFQALVLTGATRPAGPGTFRYAPAFYRQP